mmetsp:Transcript_119816/g.301223  ORF Transcript_119816/g.301223 Transcript_119816/m.301223 type:complete len:257 (+) Transcript_119816:129-899(+)
MALPRWGALSVRHELLPLRELGHRLAVRVRCLRPLLGLAIHVEVGNVLEESVRFLERGSGLVVVAVARRTLGRDVLHILPHHLQLQGEQALEVLGLLGLDEIRSLLQALEGLIQGNLFLLDVLRSILLVQPVLGVAELAVGVLLVGIDRRIHIRRPIAKAEDAEFGGRSRSWAWCTQRPSHHRCRQGRRRLPTQAGCHESPLLAPTAKEVHGTDHRRGGEAHRQQLGSRSHRRGARGLWRGSTSRCAPTVQRRGAA